VLRDALRIICEAEKEAWDKIEKARQDAAEAASQADIAGKAAIERTLARAESEIAHLTRAAEKKVTGDALELASKTANRQATIRARAERRLEAAASYIVERIVST